MKIFINTFLLSLFVGFFAINTQAQDQARAKVHTAEFEVEGVCGMCKQRIEIAALIKGVKMAEWDKDTGILVVVYNHKKTNEESIMQAVVEHGHDTKKLKASDETYSKLPGCCQYRDGIEKH